MRPRRGATLVEAALGAALLGTLLVALLVTSSRLEAHGASAHLKSEACRMADGLLETWWQAPEKFPRTSEGTVPGEGKWRWRTHIIDSEVARTLKADMIALELYQAGSARRSRTLRSNFWCRRRWMNKRALTLVELVVALAITTMLAVAALQVVSTLARTERVASAAEETDALGDSLRLLLVGDLLNADRTRETAGGFTIRTHTYLAPGAAAPQHLPSLVTYEVRKVGQRSCLFRRQQCLAEAETSSWQAATDIPVMCW